jgi:diguanylate cyclase (GGDEF)-like protein
MSKGAIVCVDDERLFLLSLRERVLRIVEYNYIVELAESGTEALTLFAELQAENIEVSLLICDQTMPGIGGIELLEKIHHQYPNTLKILLTGLANLNEIVQALDRVGVYRYISKPWDEADLSLTIREALRSYEQKKQLAAQNQMLQTINQELEKEIGDRRRAEAQLAHAALHDPLTQLPNRALLTKCIEQNLAIARENSHYRFALLFIDLDRFKIVNDGLGHTIGDLFLRTIAERFRHCLRGSDTIARFGGDEFSVLLENIGQESEAIQVAQRLLATLRHPFHLEGHTLYSSASIGIAIGSANYQKAVDLLRDADLAMYRAKGKGKSCYALFEGDLHLQSLKLLQLDSDLHQALSRKEFVIYYQPMICLNTNRLVGFEALMRWKHPSRGFIPPNEFIPVAEETGFILALGEWGLNEACRQMHSWHLEFPEFSNLAISVNLAGQQLHEIDFIDKIDRILIDTGLSASALKLELTERMLIDNVEIVLETLSKIRQRKIQLSIDDFGTGYSSLSYLARFPLDTLKIDRGFIERMTDDAENLEIVRAICTLAHSLGLDVIAEGIESQEQVELLKTFNCEFGQGYLFAEPLDREATEKLISNFTLNFS